MESLGGAAGKGLAAGILASTVLTPLGGALVGGTVALFEVAKGAFVGQAKQLEFSAFKAMTAAVKDSTEALKRFNAEEIIGVDSLKKLNSSLERTMSRF